MSEIKAGRKLDALVAEMKGWKPWVSPCAPKGSTIPDCWLTGDEENPSVRMSGYHPSSDRGEALRLLEEENRKGAAFCLLYDDDGAYACVSDGVQTIPEKPLVDHLDFLFRVPPTAWFPDIALAIVVGILRAHGVDVEAELAKGGGK